MKEKWNERKMKERGKENENERMKGREQKVGMEWKVMGVQVYLYERMGRNMKGEIIC